MTNQINPNSKLPQLTKWYRAWWGLLIIIISGIIFLAMLVFGAYVYILVNKIKSGDIADVTQSIQKIMQTPGHYQMESATSAWIGSANPKLTIVEFADFNCPFCKKSYPIIREISQKYKNDVKIIFRHYPITQDSSLDLALASECANEQNMFWHMHDKFFQTENPSSKISQISSQLPFDQNKFDACFKQQKYLNKIRLDLADAEKAEIKGTPTWFINGHKVEGEIPREVFLGVIEALLNEDK